MRLLTVITTILSTSVTVMGAGQMPKQKEYTNSVGMKFVRIEPGSFEMGNLSELLPFDMMPQDGGPGNRMDHLRVGDFDERPVHKVKITKPFYMATLEVTNSLYELFDASHKKNSSTRAIRSFEAGMRLPQTTTKPS
jgi:formylglycine-generating enzyme required for sulfatase activity